jgi:hypothetical protein
MRYLEHFDNLPNQLPMSAQTRGKLLRELDDLRRENRITAAGEAARQQRVRDIEALLQADLQCRKQPSSR